MYFRIEPHDIISHKPFRGTAASNVFVTEDGSVAILLKNCAYVIESEPHDNLNDPSDVLEKALKLFDRNMYTALEEFLHYLSQETRVRVGNILKEEFRQAA